MSGIRKDIIYVILAVLLSLLISQYYVYGIFGTYSWDSAKKYTIDLEDIDVVGGNINESIISTTSTDTQIYFNVNDDVKMICLNLSEVENAKKQQLVLYLPVGNGYTEEATIERKLREGNNVFYNSSGYAGTVRIDIGNIDGISIKVNCLECVDDLVVVPELLIVFFVVFVSFLFVGVTIKYSDFICKQCTIYKKEIFILFGFFCLYLMWSFIIPYNQGPDEFMRFDVVEYIYKYNQLPRGDDPILCTSNSWGTSYAYSPFLAYIIAAGFMEVGAAFGMIGLELLHVARLVSVVSSVITVFFLLKISDKIGFKYKYLLPCMVGLWPQFAFISSYVNNDAFAIMTTSVIIYAWLLGIENVWDKKSCLFLTVGMALCVASYYNCYGYLLFSLILFIITHVVACISQKNKKIIIDLLQKAIIIFIVVFLLSGWWFVRNYYLYGDFLGTEAAEAAKLKYAIDALKPGIKQSLYEQGVSVGDMLFGESFMWVVGSAKSFVAAFGYMTLFMPDWVYIFFFCLVFFGLGTYVFAKKTVLKTNVLCNVSLLGALCSVVILSIIYSYFSDFQAQGRYLLPMIIPLLIFVMKGYDKLHIKKKEDISILRIDGIIIAILWIINMYALWITIYQSYYWL